MRQVPTDNAESESLENLVNDALLFAVISALRGDVYRQSVVVRTLAGSGFSDNRAGARATLSVEIGLTLQRPHPFGHYWLATVAVHPLKRVLDVGPEERLQPGEVVRPADHGS